jgi:hypothetical protein
MRDTDSSSWPTPIIHSPRSPTRRGSRSRRADRCAIWKPVTGRGNRTSFDTQTIQYALLRAGFAQLEWSPYQPAVIRA